MNTKRRFHHEQREEITAPLSNAAVWRPCVIPITSDLRKSLEEESGKEKRSMASLAREAIADFIPRLRDRRRKRSPEGDRMSGHAAVSAYGRLTGDPRAIETRTGNPMNWPNPWPGM